MAKFKRSFQPGGFRPEQAGDGGEARLREYSKQVIKGLTQERDAITEDRNRTADVMKQNAQIESKQNKANAKIEQANIQQTIDEQQSISQRALREFEIKTAASQKIYQAVSDLSTTASKKFAELEVQKLEEKSQQEKAEILRLGYNHPLVKGIAKLRQSMRVEEMQGTTELNVAYARGELSELEYTKLMNQLNSLTADGKAAVLSLLGKDFASFYTQKLNTDEGRKAAGNQQATLEFGQRVLAEWEQINGITGINAALKQDSGYYDQVFSTLQSSATNAGRIETENNKSAWLSSQLHTLDGSDAATVTTHLQKIWPTMVAYLGAEKAHVVLRDWFARIDPEKEGRPRLPLSSLTNARLGLSKDKDGNIKTYGDFWPGRITEIQNTILDARDKINQRTDRIEADRAEEIGERFIETLAGLPPEERLKELNTFVRSYESRGKRAPTNVTRATAEAQLQVSDDVKLQTERLNSLVAGNNLTLENITASNFTGDVRKLAFKKLLEQEGNKKYGANYKQVTKGIDGDARKLLKLTGDSAVTSKLLNLQRAMKEQWQAWYQEGLIKNNGDEVAAASYANDVHRKNMDTFAQSTSVYFSQPASESDPTIVFTNLNNLRLNAARQEQSALDDIEDNIKSGMNLDQLLASGAVISQKEMEAASTALNAGESLAPYITNKLRHVQKIYAGKGLNVKFSDLINRSIQVHNRKNPNNQILGFPVPEVVDKVVERQARTRATIARIEAELNQQDILRNQRYIRPSLRSSVPTGGSLTTNDPRIVAIGINEGTRTAGGGTTSAYQGHTDPGDQAANRGTFSYAPSRFGTDPNMTPEQADEAYMPNLIAAENKYAPVLEQLGYQKGTQEYELAMFNILDLTVQAPAAVNDFVNIGLKNLVGQPLTKETIGDARAYAFYNPRTGRLEAKGFNNDFEKLRADQRRRSMTILN